MFLMTSNDYFGVGCSRSFGVRRACPERSRRILAPLSGGVPLARPTLPTSANVNIDNAFIAVRCGELQPAVPKAARVRAALQSATRETFDLTYVRDSRIHR